MIRLNFQHVLYVFFRIKVCLRLRKPILRLEDSLLDGLALKSIQKRSIFYAVTKHVELYGRKDLWIYFDAGNGKGPCDGLGGTKKRMADEA